jgi:hypothetical protein
MRDIAFAVDNTLAGGSYTGQVTALAADTAGTDTTGTAVFDIYLNVACEEPVWTIDPGDFEFNMTIVGRVDLEGTGVMLTRPEDRLVAFVGNQLRGMASPSEALGDTLIFLTVYSNRASNETVRFEVWDDDKCKWYRNTEERFPFIADDIIGSTAAPVTLTAVGTLSESVGVFTLDAGWNWFSTHVASGDMSVVNVLSSLSSSADDIIKSKTAFAVFDPGTPTGWVGSLTTLDNTSGYMIRLAEAGTVIHEGSLVDPSATPIPVDAGWNWISYLPRDPSSVSNSLGDLTTQAILEGGEVVKSHSAFAQWDAGWLGSLNVMEPGQGYRLLLQGSSLPGTFTYPANPAAAVGIAGASGGARREPEVSSSRQPAWAVAANRYQHNMTVIAVLQSDGVERRGDGDIVGAFVGEECRGVGNVMYVDGIDRHLVFLMIHGDDVGEETVRFRVGDAASSRVYDVVETVTFDPDAASGTLREPVVFVTGPERDGVPSVFRLTQNHPNPFNPQTSIRFELPVASRVVLTIYNVLGQEVRKLVDRNYGPGSYDVVWDGTTASGTTAASGVYFYKLKAGAFSDVKKMVLLK